MAKDIASQLASMEAELVSVAVRRLDACTFTVRTVQAELIEPSDIQRKADMLLAAEELLADVVTLTIRLREMTWPQAVDDNQTIETGNETE